MPNHDTPNYRGQAEELAADARMTDNGADKIAAALGEAFDAGSTAGYNLAEEAARAQRELHGLRPDTRRIEQNTTAHRLARDLGRQLNADGIPAADLVEKYEQYTAQALADAYTAGRADQLAEQTPAALVLTVEQLAEVRRLFYGMPYLGSVGQRAARLPDGVALVETLRGLQRVLQVVGRQEHDRTTELQQLRAQRDAFREYAGAGLLGLLALARADVAEPLEVAHRAEGPEPEGLELLGTGEEAARWQLDPAEQVKHHATALAAYLHGDDEERARQYIAAAVRTFEQTQQPDPLV